MYYLLAGYLLSLLRVTGRPRHKIVNDGALSDFRPSNQMLNLVAGLCVGLSSYNCAARHRVSFPPCTVPALNSTQMEPHAKSS